MGGESFPPRVRITTTQENSHSKASVKVAFVTLLAQPSPPLSEQSYSSSRFLFLLIPMTYSYSCYWGWGYCLCYTTYCFVLQSPSDHVWRGTGSLPHQAPSVNAPVTLELIYYSGTPTKIHVMAIWSQIQVIGFKFPVKFLIPASPKVRALTTH